MKLAAVAMLLVGCAGDGESTSEGRFSLAWQLTTNGQVTDCAAAAVETIRVVTDNGQSTTESYVCSDGMATTAPRAVGPYTITVTALDDGDAVVATASDSDSILGGQTIDLGVFPLETVAEVCDSASCPTGCCDDAGGCVDPQTDAACGISGVTCVDCTALGRVCNATDGLCIE